MIFDALPWEWHGKRRASKLGQLGNRHPMLSAGAVQLRGRADRKDWTLKLHRIEEALRDEEFDLSVELVRVLKDPDAMTPMVRASLMTKLLEFVEPKLKSTTITVNNRPVGELTEAELRAIAGIIDQDSSGAGTDEPSRGQIVPFRLRAADEPVSDAIETPRLPAE